VVQAARDLGIQKVVHTSTSEVYGTAQIVPIPETHPLVGQSPYSASKIGADQIAYSYYAAFGTPVATVRPFNTYGPRQSLRAVLPTMILQALTGSGELALGSLTPTRDFNYVDDTVSGMIAILDHSASIGEVINIGSGREISIEGTVRLVEKLTGKTLIVKTDAARLRPENSEVERLCCDFSKANRLLGWKPQTSLEDGLSATINWFADPHHRNHYHDATRYTL
jgi:dTDP-glucose 4,6-dehydratase